MPYVCLYEGRYLGEHSCGKYHYGDMSIVRQCCVEDALRRKAEAQRCALTRYHPSFRLFLAAYNELTAAEQEIVGWWEP